MLAEELAELGAQDLRPLFRGVRFAADQQTVYRIMYCTRLASRILAPLITFDCHSDRYLYKTAREMAWSDFMGPEDTFAIQSLVSDSRIRHSKFAAQRLKDAVVDRFRDRCGQRPSVDLKQPDVTFHLYVKNNRATISLDLGGYALHKRGYRKEMVGAPMQETLAAAIIRLTQWQGDVPLYDPMCGSGTLLAEALMHYCRIPAAYLGDTFGFMRLPDYRADEWKAVRRACDQQIRALPAGLISGADCDAKAVHAARGNIALLPGGDQVRIERARFQDGDDMTGCTLVTNPPYGIRIGTSEQAGVTVKEFGDYLKQHCAGCTAYIYLGDISLVKKIGLRTSFKKILFNGGLEGRLVKIDLYRGEG